MVKSLDCPPQHLGLVSTLLVTYVHFCKIFRPASSVSLINLFFSFASFYLNRFICSTSFLIITVDIILSSSFLLIWNTCSISSYNFLIFSLFLSIPIISFISSLILFVFRSFLFLFVMFLLWLFLFSPWFLIWIFLVVLPYLPL